MHHSRSLLIVVSAILLLLPPLANATRLVSAQCSEPKGVRYDHVSGAVQRNEDGFAGVRPQFVWSPSNPKMLTVLWPDSRTLGDAARQQTHEALVIGRDETMITALMLYESRVNLYTLFPNRGVAFMSTHRNLPVAGGVANGALFVMECKFQ